MKRRLLASLLCLPLIACAAQTTNTSKSIPAPVTATSVDAGTQLVQKITQGQVKIIQTFNAVDGMRGYVIQPTSGNDSRSMIVYTDANGNYMFIGTILDQSGTNLTDQYTQTYINAGIAKAAYQQINTTTWFSDGSDKAPHKAYIIIDPNCIYCHLLYLEIEPLIQQGQLQVRWVPVGFLHPSSAAKAAALLAAPADKQLALLNQNETNFNQQQEEGGIEGLPQNSNDANIDAAYKKAQKNTDFFSQMGFGGTPTLIYKDNSGKANFYPGFAKDQQLQVLINSMSNSW